MVYVWAPGEGPLSLPPNVGVALGQNGFRDFALEIHYNNPWRDAGVMDSSGVRMYYTSNKREHDMGIFQVGDPLVDLQGEAVGSGLTQHVFNCPFLCSSASISQEITVFREYLHMHQTGVRMYNTQMRGGQIVHTGVSDFFDFDQQGTFSPVQDSFTIRPGDSFQTSCFYSPISKTRFGLSSQREMCIAYLFYYPRQIAFGGAPLVCGYNYFFPQCNAQWQETSLSSTADLGRSFGSSPSSCSGGGGGMPSSVETSGPLPTLPSPAPKPNPTFPTSTSGPLSTMPSPVTTPPPSTSASALRPSAGFLSVMLPLVVFLFIPM